MTISAILLPEFDREMANTRRVLERVPEEKVEWRPHAKSPTLGWLAMHLAQLPQMMRAILTLEGLDLLAPPPGILTRLSTMPSRAEMLASFDAAVAAARTLLAEADDALLQKAWCFRRGEQVIYTLPRFVALRIMVFNHSIHHRGQLLVFLRLNDVALPALYGPTADEPM